MKISWDKILRYAPLITLGSVVVGVVAFIFAAGVFWQEAEGRLFPTVYQQQRSVQYHDQVDPVLSVRKKVKDSLQQIKDSIAEAAFRKTQDSMDAARDTLTKKTAVEVWKNTQLIKRLDTLLIEYIKIHDPN